MFKAYIEYNQKMGKIELPCDENHIKSVLESLYMTEDKILKPEIFLAEIEDFDELKILEDRFIKLDELNYLAKRLMSFDKMELDTFKAVIADGKYKELKDMINLSFSPNKYILIKDLSNPDIIGKRYFMAKNLGATEKELLEIDFEKIGREVIASSEQKLTPYGIVIENKDVELEETYNGQTFPAYGFYSHLFRAEITYGNNTEYVYMPDDEITIDKTVRRLGAETLDDCMIDIEYGDIIDKEWFDKIKGITYTEGLKAANKVLDYLDQLSSNDLEKLKAITEFADRYDSEAVIKLGENISEFDYFEGAYNMDDLGRELIEQDEDYHIHEDIADYFMYEQYAEDVTGDYDIKFTSIGAVVLKGPTLTVTNDVTLYALFKKTLTGNFYYGNNTLQTTKTVTIYNNAISGSITTPNLSLYSGWNAIGWRDDTIASPKEYDNTESISISSDTDFYGIYSRILTLYYNANGGSNTPPSQTATQYYNAYGNKENKSFVLDSTISRTGYVFDKWAKGSTNGTTYSAGSNISTSDDTTMYATWIKLLPSENPVITLSNMAGGKAVDISCAINDATIYYTLDGTTPTVNSAIYSSPIYLKNEGTYTIKAFAVKEGYEDSSIVTKQIMVGNTYVIQNGTCGENAIWVLESDGTLTISGSGEMENYGESFYTPWCENREKIITVNIENGITSIGNYSFDFCQNLTSATISDTVTHIGTEAFSSTGISNIIIPNSVESIGDWAFSGSELTNIVIPDSVTSIGAYAFNCTPLKNVTVPSTVKSLGRGVFNSSGITDAIIGCDLPTDAFWKCSGLENVTLLDGVTTIGVQAFMECENLKSITIPSSVTHIKKSAFTWIPKLADIYYTGSEEQWNTITIDSYNYLSDVTKHFGEKSGYIIKYDYSTNGGNTVVKNMDVVGDGTSVDLTVEATKDGWDFVGWNITPEAEEALSDYTATGDVTLYAIFKRDITAYFYSKENTLQKSQTTTIYNNATMGVVTAPEPIPYYEWIGIGWRDDTAALSKEYTVSQKIYVTNDIHLYAIYSRNLTLSYNANGGDTVPSDQVKLQYYNAYGNKQIKHFTLASAISKGNDIFYKWAKDSVAGVAYDAESDIAITEDTTMYATWVTKPGVAEPIILVSDIEGGKCVSISCSTTDATIHYTTDGTTPTTDSSIYTSSLDFTIAGITEIRAIAVKNGYTSSSVTIQTVVVEKATTPTPSILSGIITESISEMRNSSVATPNYNSVVFKAGELALSGEPQLMPNFVADEKEFYYQSGKLFSKLSFMDPKDSGAAIDNITVRIVDADSRIPAGAIAFGSGDTFTPVKKMGRLAAGDVFDIVWNLDIDRFFSIAEVSETETEGQYSVHFAEDVTREMIDAYIAANDPAGSGLIKEISFDGTANTGIYQAESAPSDRVPMYYGNKPYSFDFTILASGVRTDTGELVETKVPVRLHYVAPDYYAMAGESDSLYDDDGNYKGQQYMDIYDIHPDIEQKVAVSPAFEPASGRVSEMRYSTGFLHDIQANTPNLPDDTDGVSIDLGFSGDVGYEGQVTTLSMKLKNPSPKHPMENLQVKLVLTDAPYDSSGNIQVGGTVLFPNVNVYVGNDKLHEDGGVVGGTLGTEEEALIEYSFRLDKLMRSFESLSSFDETLAEYLKDTRQINKVYARIEGSFVLDGTEHSFVSGVREYEIKEQPKLYISYDLKDRGNGDYDLTATITNLGSGVANNVTIGVPAIPNTGFDMKITGVSSTKGIVVMGTSVSFDRVEISVLNPGDTAIITYELAVIGSLTDAQKISMGKLAALPSIPIKSDAGVGIVMAPMKMEAMRSQSTLENIDSIIEELGFLSNNLKILTDKTASELGRSLADYYDYSASLGGAVLIGETYSFLANCVGLVATIKDVCELPGKVSTLANKFKSIKFDDIKVKTLGLHNSSFDEAYGMLKELIKKDVDWTFDYLPKDISYWYDTYNDAVTIAETLNSTGGMSEAFREYVRITKSAADLLAEATSAINVAMNTYDTAERAENAKLARVKMEEAAALIKDAKLIKADGKKLFRDTISDVADSNGLLKGYTEDAIRCDMWLYIAEAESLLEPQITAVAAALAQLSGIENFEKQVGILQSSSSEIYNILKEDERLEKDTKALVNAANSIFEEIGYDVNASAREKRIALNMGRFKLGVSTALLSLRPLVWIEGWFNLIDTAQYKSVWKSTPDIVKTVGKLFGNYEKDGYSARKIGNEILNELFGSVLPSYDWFVDEFENRFPSGDNKQEIRRYIATEVVKIASREFINEELFNKSIESLMSSGLSDYKMVIEAASASAGGVYTDVYKIQDASDSTILEIIDLLEKYKTNPQMLTGYYPSAQLLDYVKNLNSSISAMVKYSDGSLIEPGRVGRYRSLWTYSGEGLDLNVKETTLGEIYSAQMLVDTLLAEGYSNVDKRYVLNMLKWKESMTSVAGNMVGIFSSSPVGGVVGSMIGVAGKLLDSSVYSSAMNTVDNANLYNLSRATADLAITTNLMLSKEATIANDLYSVFNTMEKWRKVDPELPLEIVTADVADLVVEDDIIFAEATAALTVLNKHTGSVTIAPTVEIYDSYGMVNTVNMGQKTIAPGEEGQFVSKICVPINMLRDMGGYTAVFTFAASEAETMTIAPSFGPYVTHFNVGTERIVDYLRLNAEAKQPLGGTLKAGESKVVSLNVAEGNLLYVFAAAKSGEDNLALTVTGAGEHQNYSHANTNDFVLIADASGEYIITVSNNGDKDLEYALITVVSPDMGAVAGLDMPYANVMAGQYSYLDGGETVTGIKASIPVSIYETGLTTGMDVSISASALDDGMGHIIPTPKITDLKGYDVSSDFRLEAGEGKSLILGYYPEGETPDGDYSGNVTLRVGSESFEHDLTPLGWTLNGDAYELTIPVSVRINSEIPAAAELISACANADGRIAVEGRVKPGSFAVVFLAKDEASTGVIGASITPEADGTFSVLIKPDDSGSYYVYVRAADEKGAMGVESKRILVTTDISDKTAPVITMISPQTDIQLPRAVKEIIFTVRDDESPIVGTPTLTVDGVEAKVTCTEEGRYRAVPYSGSIGEGTHIIEISAVSGGGVTTKEFTVIVGGKVEAVISVTANGRAVAGALVTLGSKSDLTDDDGKASFSIAPGEYNYSISKEGYLPKSGSLNITATSRNKNVDLEAGGVINVVVTSGGQPVSGAEVSFGEWSAVSGNDGIAQVLMPYGTYDYQISAAGYRNEKGSFTFAESTVEPLKIELSVDKSSVFAARLHITDAAGKAISGIRVTLDRTESTTDTNGDVLFLKNVGAYEYEISGELYQTFKGTVNVDSSGKIQSIALAAAGASYNKDDEILKLEAGYKAWTDKVGGEEIRDGELVKRDRTDRIIYIEGGSGIRVPFVIPAIEVVIIKNAERAEDGERVEITIVNQNGTPVSGLWLIGSIYDADGRCIKTTTIDISNLAAGEQYIDKLDFGYDIQGYACKIFLWEKASLKPLCPSWTLPLVIPENEGAIIKNAERAEDGEKVEVTIVNQNSTPVSGLWLIGSIYDADGRCIKTTTIDISNLAAGEQYIDKLDFGCNIQGYACKIFLWEKASLKPLCPSWKLSGLSL